MKQKSMKLHQLPNQKKGGSNGAAPAEPKKPEFSTPQEVVDFADNRREELTKQLQAMRQEVESVELQLRMWDIDKMMGMAMQLTVKERLLEKERLLDRIEELCNWPIDRLRAAFPEMTETRGQLIQLCKDLRLTRGEMVRGIIEEEFDV